MRGDDFSGSVGQPLFESLEPRLLLDVGGALQQADGYVATGVTPVVVQDTKGEDAVWVYGSPGGCPTGS
jgi:hypothetical protein